MHELPRLPTHATAPAATPNHHPLSTCFPSAASRAAASSAALACAAASSALSRAAAAAAVACSCSAASRAWNNKGSCQNLDAELGVERSSKAAGTPSEQHCSKHPPTGKHLAPRLHKGLLCIGQLVLRLLQRRLQCSHCSIMLHWVQNAKRKEFNKGEPLHSNKKQATHTSP